MAFSGHRLLTEYFAFPEKFLYVELAGLEARSLVQRSGEAGLHRMAIDDEDAHGAKAPQACTALARAAMVVVRMRRKVFMFDRSI